MMSINSLRPNPYRPPNPPKPLQPRFGTPPEDDAGGLQAGSPPLSTDNKTALKELLDSLQQQKEGLEAYIKGVTAALGITQEGGSDPVSASAEDPASVEKSEAAETDHPETQTPPQPKYTPRSERTRPQVALDMTREYFGSNKVWVDMGASVAVGAVFAIGSPVMAVTIPTTMMVIGGFRLARLLEKVMRDPKGPNVDKMYQKWVEADAVQAKKKAEPSS
jgi:hypothetical protein